MRQNRISTFIPVCCFFRSSLFCTLALPITKNHLDTILGMLESLSISLKKEVVCSSEQTTSYLEKY